MDIARIRKKSKETTPSGEATKDVAPETVRPGVEDVSGMSGRLPAAAAGAGEEKVPTFAPEEAADPLVELLTFVLGEEEYAFRIGEVHEIIRPQRITRIPRAEASLLGITSLRGKIIPVIDLRKTLSLDGKAGQEGRKQKILILNGVKGPFGAMIDRVVGVIRSRASGIVETPAHLPEAQMKFIEGVAVMDGKFISILSIGEVITL
ncbi:MAG TPA: chemotaxis protein CheW [Thermodesulfovibrionales bacterium]|nr:chemotaxis protein CheW [Thermodesulfovibrionales bacterium]